MKANDTVTFVVANNGRYNYDSTELYAWVDEDAVLMAKTVLSIDLNGTANGSSAWALPNSSPRRQRSFSGRK